MPTDCTGLRMHHALFMRDILVVTEDIDEELSCEVLKDQLIAFMLQVFPGMKISIVLVPECQGYAYVCFTSSHPWPESTTNRIVELYQKAYNAIHHSKEWIRKIGGEPLTQEEIDQFQNAHIPNI